MVRPLIAGVRPPCPDRGHEGGSIRLAGVRKRADGLYSRPIYRCYPPAGAGWDPSRPTRTFHRFTDTREHTTADHPNGEVCAECEIKPERHQGPLVPFGWDFAARQISEALLLVGRGLSYRKTAQQLRLNVRRHRTDADGLAVVSREGGTAQRYIDVFGPMILNQVEHRSWPEVLLLDALPVRLRNLDEEGRGSQGGTASGAFLAAMGYTSPMERLLRQQRPKDGEEPRWRPTDPQRHPHLWHLALAGGTDASSWWEFLDELDGEPSWVVIDGDQAVRLAVLDKWEGRPVIYSCEGHLMASFQRAAAADGVSPHDSAKLLSAAFHDQQSWADFIGRLLELGPEEIPAIAAWVGREHTTITEQMKLRRPGFPRGIGAMEASLQTLDHWIGDRRKVFQNVYRTNITLGLMRSQLGGHADAALYSKTIRAELEAVDARPDVLWGKHHDKNGRRGLFALADQAAARQVIAKKAGDIATHNR